MPARNAEPTIVAAIRSTLRALPRDSFLYVYLDACTDNTATVVGNIADERLKVFEGSQPRGVAGALNYLLEAVQTGLVARMDADDICLPNRFAKQLKMLEENDADFVFLNAILFGKTVRPFGFLPQPPLRISESSTASALVASNPFVHPTLLAKTKSIRQLVGYTEAPAEDYHMWLDASLAGLTLVRGRSYGILYRIHSSQLTRQSTWQDQLAADSLLSLKIEALRLKIGLLVADTSNTSNTSNTSLTSKHWKRATDFITRRFIG